MKVVLAEINKLHQETNMSTPLKNTITFIRDSVNVAFYEAPDAFNNYVKQTYVDSGAILLRNIKETPNGLKRTRTVVWRSAADQETFSKDPMVVEEKARRDNYLKQNGIRQVVKNKLVY